MICDEAWAQFVLYMNAIMYGSKDYNNPDVRQLGKQKGNTVFGNKDATIFDVFNFWREEILEPPGHPYSKKYLSNIVQLAIEDEPWLPV